ncbi:MAG: SGNH/GDSL hydrolase family protein [Candidatus Acidiferrum sp.]
MKRALLLVPFVLLMAGTVYAQQAGTQEPPAKALDNCTNLPSLEKKVEALEALLKDWPELSRYHEANTTLVAPAKDEERVVFMGDSITDMWQYPQFGGFFPGKPYIDRGIGGQTTPQMLLRFRPDVLALHPRAVVILAGTNDIAGNTGPLTLEETEGNLASMSELAHAHGIRVVLASVMPVNDVTTPDGKKIMQTGKRPPEKILALNEWIKKYAAEHGDVYLDYFSATVDDKGFLKSELTNDGLHPQAKGYAIMAPLAEKAIVEAEARKP